MSLVVKPVVLPSQNTTSILSINLKVEQEEHKINNLENLACEFEEKLIKKLDEKTDDQGIKDRESQAKGDDPSLNDDKVVEDLSKCKQQVVGSIIGTSVISENKGPKVQILSLSVFCPGRKDVVLGVPFPSTTSKATLFSLKEGSKYRTQYHFKVSNNIVNGLSMIYMVWKAGIKVNQTKKLVGTFSPREEPYIFEASEGTTPSGFFVRGSFLIKVKFVDDDGNCYLDTTYYFDIKKEWGANDKC